MQFCGWVWCVLFNLLQLNLSAVSHFLTVPVEAVTRGPWLTQNTSLQVPLLMGNGDLCHPCMLTRDHHSQHQTYVCCYQLDFFFPPQFLECTLWPSLGSQGVFMYFVLQTDVRLHWSAASILLHSLIHWFAFIPTSASERKSSVNTGNDVGARYTKCCFFLMHLDSWLS